MNHTRLRYVGAPNVRNTLENFLRVWHGEVAEKLDDPEAKGNLWDLLI